MLLQLFICCHLFADLFCCWFADIRCNLFIYLLLIAAVFNLFIYYLILFNLFLFADCYKFCFKFIYLFIYYQIMHFQSNQLTDNQLPSIAIPKLHQSTIYPFDRQSHPFIHHHHPIYPIPSCHIYLFFFYFIYILYYFIFILIFFIFFFFFLFIYLLTKLIFVQAIARFIYLFWPFDFDCCLFAVYLFIYLFAFGIY